MPEFFIQDHQSQSQPGTTSVTRRYGCTWTSLANGVGAITGGDSHPTPDQIHAVLPRSEETDPTFPGWSMADAVHAMSRYGVGFQSHWGDGWSDFITALLGGHYGVLQGDSDQFGNNTCSGAYDGPHAIGVSPNHRTVNGEREWWIDDPICPTGRWEKESVLRRYAVKFYSGISWGIFNQPVPLVEALPVNPKPGTGVGNVTIRYANVTSGTRMKLAKGQVCYASPGGKAVTKMSRASSVPHLGQAGKGWRAVLIGTRVGYPDGKTHRTVLYVPAKAGEVTAA